MNRIWRALLIGLSLFGCGVCVILVFRWVGFSTEKEYPPLELASGAEASKVSGDLTIWGWNVAVKDMREKAVGFREAYPNVNTKLELAGINAEARFFLSLAAGVGAPDVMQLQNREGPLYTAMERLTDLTEVAAPYTDSFAPAFWANCLHEGRVYGIPWDMGPAAIFYKRSVFEKYGVDPNSIETWDEFIEEGKRVVKASNGKVRMLNFPIGGLMIGESFVILLQQVGGQVFEKDDSIAIYSEASLKALRVMRNIVSAKIHSNFDDSMSEYYSTFNMDTVASYISGSWFGGILKVYGDKRAGDWGIMRLPAFTPGGLRASNLGGSILVIPDQSENKEAAWRFIEYQLCRREGQLDSYRNNDLFPTMLDALDDPFFQEPDPFFGNQAVREVFSEDVEKIPELRRTQYWLEASDIISRSLSEWVITTEAPERYLEQLEVNLSRRLSLPISPNSLSRANDAEQSVALKEVNQ